MPADCNSEPLTRSGAANPQVKGTPNRAEPKTQSPYLSAAQPAVQDTVSTSVCRYNSLHFA